MRLSRPGRQHPAFALEPDQHKKRALRHLRPIVRNHEIKKAVSPPDPARHRQHDQRERDPGHHIGNGFYRDDQQAARPFPLGDRDAHRQQHQVKRIGDCRGAERAPEPVGGAIETRKPATIAARQPQRADQRQPHLRPCRRRHQRLVAGSKNRVEKGSVDLGQVGEIGERDPLVDLVHRQADQTELGDRAMRLNKARIRGAAGRAEFGRSSGDAPDRLGETLAERSGRGRETIRR